MKVVQFTRKPSSLAFSLERVFEDVRQSLPADIDVDVYSNPFPSRGIGNRLLGIFRAALHQGDINHITGDVHYLNILMRKRATVLTIPDCVSLERATGIRYWLIRFFWYWLPIRRSAVITVISESARRELVRHLGVGNWPIKVIPCPVSPEFTYTPKEIHCVCPRILQVGTTPNKNIERISSALRGVNCKLVVVGQLAPEQVAALRSNGIDYEIHVGVSREAMLKEYQKCDMLMFASLYEGFGLPILEAQAVGRPVITSNLYSMPEVGGEGACYVDPFDIRQISAAVYRITNDPGYRKHLVESGLANVSRFGASEIAQQYARLYEHIYAKHFCRSKAAKCS